MQFYFRNFFTSDHGYTYRLNGLGKSLYEIYTRIGAYPRVEAAHGDEGLVSQSGCSIPG
jgi:hypothetical protein